MKTDPFWRDRGAEQIVFSGPDVPGEGEHKIMECIRQLDNHSNYIGNTDNKVLKKSTRRHCLYGLDADLIMLRCYLMHDVPFSLNLTCY
jgi:5'-3' exoribonuclease 1